MKKLLFKMIILVGILLAVPYYLLGKGSLPDFLKNFSSSEKKNLPKNLTNAVTDKEVSVYQWVDKNGRTHFSSTPPADQKAELRILRPDTNVIQAVKMPEAEDSEESGKVFSLGSKKGGGKNKDDDDDKLYNPYTPEGMQKLIQDAKNTQQMMNDNQEKQKRIIDGL